MLNPVALLSFVIQSILFFFCLAMIPSKVLLAHANLTTRQGQPKSYISAQRDIMDLKGGSLI